MAQPTYGLNVLSQYVQDRQALLQWVEDAQPGAMTVMDDYGTAQAIRLVSPSTTVIHRSYHPQDHEFHLHLTPEQFANAYLNNVPPGMAVQVLNEPYGYSDLRPLAHWNARVMELAAQRNVRVCVVNFGVGHPDSNRVAAGELDELLHAFQRYPEHMLGDHEYASYSTVDERPFRIGRFLDTYQRCDKLGLKRPRVIVTECGRDVGGGASDGWKGVGWSETQYADFLGGLRDLYRAYNVVCCVFCHGRGANGQWASFDVEHAETVLGRLIQYNREQIKVDDLVYVKKPYVTYALNLRQSPSTDTEIVGSVAQNEKVTLLEANVTVGWVKVLKGNVPGFVSLQTSLPFDQQVKVTAAG